MHVKSRYKQKKRPISGVVYALGIMDFSELAKQKRNTKLFVLLANLEFINYTKYVIYDY